MKSTRWVLLTSLIVAILFLVACGQQATVEPGAAGETPTETPEVAGETDEGDDGAQDSDVLNYESLVDVLRNSGATIEQADTVVELFANAQATSIEVDGEIVQIFEFESKEAVAEAAATINETGTAVGISMIDWAERPHFYQKDRLIVLYAGTDEVVLAMLEKALGEPFIVGQAMGQGGAEAEDTPDADTVSHGGDAVDYVSLVDNLRAAGATVAVGETVSQPFFEPEAQLIQVNDEDVQVFEFADETTMEEAATLVSSNGSSIGTAMVSWMASPHFYKQGRIIVIYIGDNAETIALLEGVLGEQFAGG